MGDNLCPNLFANHWQLTKSTVRPWLGPFVMEGARKVFICLPAPANLTNICWNRKLANLLLRSRRFNYHSKAFPLTWQGDVWLLTMYLFLFPMSQSSRVIHIADVISPGLEHMQLCFSSNTPRSALLDYQLSHKSKTFKKTWMPWHENSPISNKKPTTERYEWMQATMWEWWQAADQQPQPVHLFISWAWLKSIIERREGHISWLPRRINFFLLGEFLWSWNL